MVKKLINITFIILLVGSGFYLAGLTSFSPVYFAFLFGTLIILILALKKKFPIDNLILANFLIFILLVTVQLFLFNIIRRSATSFLCLLYFIIIYWIGYFMSYKSLIRSINISFFFLSIVFFIEFYFRLFGKISLAIFALKDLNVSHEFYELKGNSIMFMDSNHVGMVILTFYGLLIYLLKEHKINKVWFIYLVVFFLFILFTFSRAAIVASIVFAFLFLFFKINKSFIKIILLLAIVMLFLINFIIPFYSKDPSFLSKFMILKDVVNYTRTSNFMRLFFGVGYGNSPKYLGIGTHNLVLTYYVEGGILAIILFSLLYGFFLKKTSKVLYVILPFLFAGMSFAPQVQTYYFSALAVIILLEQKKPIYAQ